MDSCEYMCVCVCQDNPEDVSTIDSCEYVRVCVCVCVCVSGQSGGHVDN